MLFEIISGVLISDLPTLRLDRVPRVLCILASIAYMI